MTLAAVRFDHLLRLTDDTGLLEHARGAVARRGNAYCVDDAARGLLVVSREPDPSPALARAGECYLALLAFAQAGDGQSHNRLRYDRRWGDTPGTGDWWGRSLWGLGTAAARHRDPWVRAAGLECFEQGARCRAVSPRAMAFAALGAAEVLAVIPDHVGAQSLASAAVRTIRRPPVASIPTPDWPWPEPRLAYANAVLPEALIAAGWAVGNEVALTEGLGLLAWLLDTESSAGHLSVTPTSGWAMGEARPGFDQQPIEAASLADACARAFAVTADTRWLEGIGLAAGWFFGDNDAGVTMLDPSTAGGYDGLTANGPNTNQGAESTLALISTLQHSRCRAPIPA